MRGAARGIVFAFAIQVLILAVLYFGYHAWIWLR